jgi:plastocyanin
MRQKGIVIPIVLVAVLLLVGIPIAVVIGLNGNGSSANDAAAPSPTAVLGDRGDRGSGPTNAVGAPASAVNIVDFEFQPNTFTVKQGTQVVFTNTSKTLHTVAIEGSDPSGTLAAGQTFTWTAGAPGTYSFHCTIHPNLMSGTITVQ